MQVYIKKDTFKCFLYRPTLKKRHAKHKQKQQTNKTITTTNKGGTLKEIMISVKWLSTKDSNIVKYIAVYERQ